MTTLSVRRWLPSLDLDNRVHSLPWGQLFPEPHRNGFLRALLQDRLGRALGARRRSFLICD